MIMHAALAELRGDRSKMECFQHNNIEEYRRSLVDNCMRINFWSDNNSNTLQIINEEIIPIIEIEPEIIEIEPEQAIVDNVLPAAGPENNPENQITNKELNLEHEWKQAKDYKELRSSFKTKKEMIVAVRANITLLEIWLNGGFNFFNNKNVIEFRRYLREETKKRKKKVNDV